MSERPVNLTTLYLGRLRPPKRLTWLNRVSNPGPLAYESGALSTAIRGPAQQRVVKYSVNLLQLGGAQPTRFCRTITMVRDSKQSFYDKIADKLKCETLSSKDWWSTLKTVIAPNSKSTIPLLTYNDNIYSDERDKANILNDYFQSQTLLDDQNAVLPELTPSVTYTQLSHIVLTPLEVESVLKTLTTGKASGPNELSNRILRELSCKLSSPFCSLLIIL